MCVCVCVCVYYVYQCGYREFLLQPGTVQCLFHITGWYVGHHNVDM